MKIFKVSFKNINNLKGENSISFEEEPLSSAGIFAITGPTGSGKSTILDVITLALFNKIPRFKGNISKNAIEGMGSVITHHTSDAYARLDYEIKGKRYTSEWITKNTKAGKFVDYEMFIYDEQGRPLDLKKSEVPSKNEDIIGLKYDQFVKSIILSQGQFAKFLKASKDERGQLLENLTGSSIYRKIGVKTFEKYRAIKTDVMMEKDRLENITCLTEAQRTELSKDITELSQKKIAIDEVLKKETNLKLVKSEIKKLNAEIIQRKSDQQMVFRQETTFEASKKKLEIYDKLAPLRGEITRFQDADAKIKITLNSIAVVKQNVVIAQNEYTSAIASMGQLTNQNVDGDNFSEVMSAFEKEINNLDQEIKHIISKGKETRDRIKTKADKGRINLGEKPNPSAAIPMLEDRKKGALQIINSAGLNVNSNVQEVRQLIADDAQNLQTLKELKHGQSHEAELAQKILECSQKETQYKTEISKYEPLVNTTNELVSATKEKIELLEKQKRDELLIASLTDHRTNLEDGKPCPLCGAEHHPWADHSPKDKSDVDNEISATRKNLSDQQTQLQQYSKSLTTNQTALKINTDQIEKISVETKNVKTENLKLVKQYKGKESTKPAEIAGSIQKIESKISSLTEAVTSIEELSVIGDLLIDFTELDNISTTFKKLDAEKKSKYSGTDVSADCNRLQDQFMKSQTKMATYNSRLEEAEKSLVELHEITTNSHTILKPQLAALGFSEISQANAYLISESELSRLKAQSEQIAKDKTAIATQIETLATNLDLLQKQDTNPELSLDELTTQVAEKEALREQFIKGGAEKSALLKKDDEEQERLKNKAKELEKLNQKLEKWDLLNKMIGDKNGNKFANFAQGLTLQNLLVFANRRLQNLSDRYLLDKPVDDGPLTVLDQYQGNIQRSVTTLSGGESFLISLALALSLSDMASKNVKLESLFIDEGFGTLDQETLEVAMNTLEKLQTESQKTVGVISHVETLKDRINVQIKLQKDAMGYSSILVES